VLLADHKLWSWRKEALDQAKHEYLEETRKIATLALLALWVVVCCWYFRGISSRALRTCSTKSSGPR
jgi:hypothetical protein